MEKYSVGISGVGSYIPDKIVSNDDLAKVIDTSHEWIYERTGIEERRIADQSIATSDMGTIAAERAMKDANLGPEDIDLIIFSTVTSDHLFPSTACIVQKNIGAKKAAAMDLNAGCTGFIYGMTTGASFIQAGIYKRILVIGGETLSRIVDWEDRSTCVLFGDGAGACILERCENGYGILAQDLGSDGADGQALIMPAGGSRKPVTKEVIDQRENYLRMDGREVFKFAVRTMGKVSLKVLDQAGLKKEDIDLLIPHQANVRIIDSASKKLNLPKEKIFVNLNKYGNTSAASIPLALDEALREKRIKKGDNILLVAFGAGLTWGASLMKWNREEKDV